MAPGTIASRTNWAGKKYPLEGGIVAILQLLSVQPRVRYRAAAISVSMCILGGTAQAVETYPLADRWDTPFATVRIFSTTDSAFNQNPDGTGQTSAWNLTAGQKAQVLSGLQYWADIIRVAPGYSPVVLNVGTMFADPENASAASPLVPGPDVAPLQVQAALQNWDPGALRGGAHGVITMNQGFSMLSYTPSQIPLLTAGSAIHTVLVHEMGHALGISTDAENTANEGAAVAPVFSTRISEWTAHLRDDNGRAPHPGQVIYCARCENPAASSVFDLRKDAGYFTGDHVSEVLGGAMPGVPVRILGQSGGVDTDFMSHLELKNSVMSHQKYRNYTGFMEAELAVLQDLDYDIDRRNFFGSSIYGSGLTVTNDNGYFARNADGTAYLPNTYSRVTQGLGLHVYGSFNTVFQRADLLTKGAGGAGIRVDGEGNTLAVLPGTRVYADGDYGRAVMFTYGRNHAFVQRGDVEALGAQGIAASFDFGNNELSNRVDYRGSFIHTVQEQTAALPDELNGPLVTQFDLSGRLAGSYAAIYLSENAYVGKINVMRGASLAGDIISRYAQRDASNQLRLTELTFGKAADADGRATGEADPGFRLAYDGNITGPNVSLQFAGGTTQLSGNHVVDDVGVARGATLMGNGSFTVVGGAGATAPASVSGALTTSGQLTNSGTLVPLLSSTGNSITINGNYVQTPVGTLQIDLNAAKTFTRLIVNGNAVLDGTLAIAPQRGWYASGFGLNVDHLVTATSIAGTFANVTSGLASPTLSVGVSPLGDGAYAVTVARATNAYSRYGANPHTQQVGGALDRMAGTAGAALQPLIAALDFSAADGSEVRRSLRQLSPGAYGAMFAGALLRERQITDLVAAAVGADATRGWESERNTAAGAAQASGGWRAFAMPFGAGYWRGGAGDMPGANGNTYGVVFGTERVASEAHDWTFGVHGAVSGQSTRLDGASGSGVTSALDAGVHARYGAEALGGPHAFAAVRVGVEDGRVDRSVAVNGYTGSARGTWTGASAAATAGGGWRWALAPAMGVGPIAALDYAMLHRPGVTETGRAGDGGMRLTLDGETFQSLRSRLGADIRFELPASAGNALRANLQTTWNHEFLGGAVTQGAAFAGAPSARFTTRTEVVGRDSVGVQAGLTYRLGTRMTFGAAVAGNWYRAGDADIAGSVSATWRF
ncbi:outer membrane autotransporter [Pandoraea sputorum]|uniref:Outer membrane autotransporter n=1 Tax=Pandoraea sputorum TaxID=93222 RepID=A0A5E5BHM9_9BURK|nr:outer membrane autotransporter [Pandoraea sputorum]